MQPLMLCNYHHLRHYTACANASIAQQCPNNETPEAQETSGPIPLPVEKEKQKGDQDRFQGSRFRDSPKEGVVTCEGVKSDYAERLRKIFLADGHLCKDIVHGGKLIGMIPPLSYRLSNFSAYWVGGQLRAYAGCGGAFKRHIHGGAQLYCESCRALNLWLKNHLRTASSRSKIKNYDSFMKQAIFTDLIEELNRLKKESEDLKAQLETVTGQLEEHKVKLAAILKNVEEAHPVKDAQIPTEMKCTVELDSVESYELVEYLQHMLIQHDIQGVLKETAQPLAEYHKNQKASEWQTYVDSLTNDNKKLLIRQLRQLDCFKDKKKEIYLTGTAAYLSAQLMWLKFPKSHPKPERPQKKRKSPDEPTKEDEIDEMDM
jgi:hypothetical protein